MPQGDETPKTGRCHLLIRGGSVIDGTGAAARPADVAIDGARILAVGDLSGWRADETLEAAGLATPAMAWQRSRGS